MGGDGSLNLREPVQPLQAVLDPALSQRGSRAVPAAPGCAELVLAPQGHVLVQDTLPIKFSGVKHYSCWQLWAAALSLVELRVEHNRERTFAHKLG